MKLFHFTSRYHVQDVLRTGIIKGVIPSGYSILRPVLVYGYQWLTLNPSPDQSWNEGSTLPYNRCEYRLTVKVPEAFEPNVLDWLAVCHSLTTVADELNSFGDPENWRLYKGNIPPEWIKRVERFKQKEMSR